MKKIFYIIFILLIMISCSKKITKQNYWDNIYEKAKKEKNVTVYSLSSRIFDAIEDFNEYFPGINVLAFDIAENEVIDLINKDIETGQANLDIIFTANEELIRNDYKDYFINYIPPVLLDNIKTKEVINERFLNPSLTQSISTDQIFYNIEKYPKKSPINNLWDLTTEKWNNNVFMKNPLLEKSYRIFINKIIKEHKLMEKAYYKKFGVKPVLSSGIENAGYEWVYRFFRNNPILTTSAGAAAKRVGSANQSDPPIGFLISTAKLRYNKIGYNLGIAWDVYPISGMSKKVVINIAKNSKKPNASKLLATWLLGYKDGEGGIKPFNVVGQWPTRTDIETRNISLNKIQEKTWLIDYESFTDEFNNEAEDFWLKFIK